MEDTITGVEFYSNVKTSEVEWISYYDKECGEALHVIYSLWENYNVTG